jgi:hypothetical protein
VAILQRAGFNPVVVESGKRLLRRCGRPAARTCQEVHNTGHREDADKDRDIDLLLHYETRKTGIDVGDTSACLTGTTLAGGRSSGVTRSRQNDGLRNKPRRIDLSCPTGESSAKKGLSRDKTAS